MKIAYFAKLKIKSLVEINTKNIRLINLDYDYNSSEIKPKNKAYIISKLRAYQNNIQHKIIFASRKNRPEKTKL